MSKSGIKQCKQCNKNRKVSIFPLLQPVAELPRNQRDEIGHQHVKAHYAVASVYV